jgi:hypothetical protein
MFISNISEDKEDSFAAPNFSSISCVLSFMSQAGEHFLISWETGP